MEQKISLCELVRILDNYSRTNDFVRVVSLGAWVEKTNGTEELIKIPYFEEKEIVLTKEEAIKRHRMMWNWIAYETLKRKERVTKREAIEHFGWFKSEMLNECWCCEYVKNYRNGCSDSIVAVREYCSICPIRWPNDLTCCNTNGLYTKWVETIWRGDYEKAAEYAFQIANLPEREDV